MVLKSVSLRPKAVVLTPMVTRLGEIFAILCLNIKTPVACAYSVDNVFHSYEYFQTYNLTLLFHEHDVMPSVFCYMPSF